MRTVCAVRSLNWGIFSASTVSIFLLIETFLIPGQHFRLANCLPPQRQTNSGWRYKHFGQPWYSPPLGARSGLDSFWGYCHSNHTDRQTGKKTCGLPPAFPPTGRRGPDRLLRPDIAGPDDRRPQRQTRDWNRRLNTRRENSYVTMPTWTPSDLWNGRPNHQTMQPPATLDILDIVIAKVVPFPVHLTSCSALSSDHHPVLIDTMCRSSL